MNNFKRLIILVNLILVAAQVLLACRRAGDGAEVSEISRRSKLIISENHSLEAQILSLSSLSYIKQKSTDLGLAKVRTTTLDPAMVASKQ